MNGNKIMIKPGMKAIFASDGDKVLGLVDPRRAGIPSKQEVWVEMPNILGDWNPYKSSNIIVIIEDLQDILRQYEKYYDDICIIETYEMMENTTKRFFKLKGKRLENDRDFEKRMTMMGMQDHDRVGYIDPN